MKAERLKVKGKVRVALTQSRGRLETLQEMLEGRGFEVVRQPLIAKRPLLDEKTRHEAEKLLECAWILFTSRTAAETWQELGLTFNKGPFDIAQGQPLATVNVGAVGKKTAEALQHLGAEVSIIADQQNAENFADMFLSHPDASSPVGLPQGDKALDTVQTKLRDAGFEVRPVVIYKTMVCPQSFENADVIVLASPSAVEAVVDKAEAQLVAIGDTTLRAVEARGWRGVKSSSPEAEAILEAIEINTLRHGE